MFSRGSHGNCISKKRMSALTMINGDTRLFLKERSAAGKMLKWDPVYHCRNRCKLIIFDDHLWSGLCHRRIHPSVNIQRVGQHFILKVAGQLRMMLLF